MRILGATAAFMMLATGTASAQLPVPPLFPEPAPDPPPPAESAPGAPSPSGATLSLERSRVTVPYGGRMQLGGQVANHPAGNGGLGVDLLIDEYPFDGTDWVRSTSADSTGRYTFNVRPWFNSRYRVLLHDEPAAVSPVRNVFALPRPKFEVAVLDWDPRHAVFWFELRAPFAYRTSHATFFHVRHRINKVYVYALRRKRGVRLGVIRLSKVLQGSDGRRGGQIKRRITPRLRRATSFTLCARRPFAFGMGQEFFTPACGRKRVRFR